MAGDWIKLEHATADKPEILELAEMLSISHGDAFLLCVRAWVWADQQSRSGHALRVTKTGLDALLRCSGFANAMIHVGWMSGGDGALTFVNFDRHNGKTSKERALATKRKQVERINGHDDVTVMSRSERDKSVTREEKRREDKDTARKRALPDDWIPAEKTVTDLSREFGLRVPEDVDRYVASFRDACKAKGYAYKDFDAAFRNCVRQDWPKLRGGKPKLNGDPTPRFVAP